MVMFWACVCISMPCHVASCVVLSNPGFKDLGAVRARVSFTGAAVDLDRMQGLGAVWHADRAGGLVGPRQHVSERVVRFMAQEPIHGGELRRLITPHCSSVILAR